MSRILLLLAFILPLSAFSQKLMLNSGDWEVTASAGFSQEEIYTEARVGVFLYDHTLLGLDIDWADNDFATRTQFGVYAYHLFETREYWLPYVGAGLGYGSMDVDGGGGESGLELSLFAGIKYYLDDNVSLNTELHIGVSTGDTYLSNDNADSTDFGLRIGLSYLF